MRRNQPGLYNSARGSPVRVRELVGEAVDRTWRTIGVEGEGADRGLYVLVELVRKTGSLFQLLFFSLF